MKTFPNIFKIASKDGIIGTKKIVFLASRKYNFLKLANITIASFLSYVALFIGLTILVVYLSDIRTDLNYSLSEKTNNLWDKTFDFLREQWNGRIISFNLYGGLPIDRVSGPALGNSLSLFFLVLLITITLVFPFFYALGRIIRKQRYNYAYKFLIKLMLFFPSVLLYVGIIATSDNLSGSFLLSFNFDVPSTWALPVFIQTLPFTSILIHVIDLYRKHVNDEPSMNLLKELRIKKSFINESYLKIKVNSYFLIRNKAIALMGLFIMQLIFESAIDYPGFGTLLVNSIFEKDVWVSSTILVWFMFCVFLLIFLLRFFWRVKRLIFNYEK